MTDRYTLFGHPVSHSKSPLIHAAFAQALGHDIEYGLSDVPPGGFAAAAQAFRDGGAKGCNITTPFKIDAFEWATQRLPRAEQAGASNCLKFEPDGRVLAEMFDGVGLAKDIEHNLGFALRKRRVLLLGAGGAARGAIGPLLERGPARLVLANRTAAKARELAGLFAADGALHPIEGCGFDELGGERFDLVVNATSSGLRSEPLALPASVFADTALAYDMSYGRGLTPFLRQAREAGAGRVSDGLGMLVEQAAEAWVWWRGVRPATRAVIDALTVPLT